MAASVQSALTALERSDAAPRSSEPLLRLSRLVADLEFRARAEAAERGGLTEVCAAVQQELARVDQDIAERYFAGSMAAPAAVVGI